MDIRIKATDYEMTPATSQYLDDKLARIEKVLANDADAARCEVEVGRDAGRPRHGKKVFFAEIRVIPPEGKSIRATNHSESVNGAIDDVQQEILRQLKRARMLHVRIARKSGAAVKWLMRRDDA